MYQSQSSAGSYLGVASWSTKTRSIACFCLVSNERKIMKFNDREGGEDVGGVREGERI